MDAILRGTITDRDDRAGELQPGTSRRRATSWSIRMKIEFVDVKDNGRSGRTRDDRSARSTTCRADFQAGNPQAFFGQGANALERVATDFARTVVSAILEAF